MVSVEQSLESVLVGGFADGVEMPAPKVSCIIVNYNTREQTSEFLASLVPEVEPLGAEILVIDNGSVDGSTATFRSSFPTVTVVEANANLGFAKAVNLGAGRARGQYLLLLNPDMVAKPGSVAALVGFADDHSEYGIYGGRTIRSDGSLEPSSCWAAPTLWSLLMFATMLSTVLKHSPIFDPESMGRWQRDTIREVEIVTGCLMLIRRELFWQLGGMDEDYFLYGEDAEFSLRCRQRGWRAVIVPTAEMVHEVGGSTGSSGGKTCMVLAGKVTMLRKVWPRAAGAIGIRLLLAGVAVRAGLERLLLRPGPWTPAWRRRADWSIGYPGARRTLFGLDP
jgi:N-acetylglucosaminyl-diphospho-decaprenol L-rhamnosyltransferase